MHFASCQHPYEPCVDGSESEFALLGPLAGSWDILKYPMYFSSAEVCVDDQAGLIADGLDETFFLLKSVTEAGRVLLSCHTIAL